MAAAPALMIVGSALGAVGELRSASANAGAARYNAQVNEMNARITREQGEVDAFQVGQLGYRKLSSIKAAVGASGLQMEGSPLDVLESSASQAEYDVQRVRHNARLKEYGYLSSAELDRTKAKNAKTDGLFRAAAGSLIGGSRAMSMQGAGTPLPVDPYAGTPDDFQSGTY